MKWNEILNTLNRKKNLGALISASFSLVFFLLILLPMLYTSYDSVGQREYSVINGYSLMIFTQDEGTFPAIGSWLMLGEYVVNALLLIFSLYLCLSSETKYQKAKEIFHCILLVLNLSLGIAAMVLFFLSSKYNLYVNLGFYVLIVYEIAEVILSLLFQRKNKDNDGILIPSKPRA